MSTDSYRKLAPKQFPRLPARLTAENRYWRRFKTTLLEQQIGAVTCVAFNPAKPGEVAITSSTRVVFYDATSGKMKRQISKFKDVAYSGTYRSDGKLMAAGGESGIIQIFNMADRGILRHLKSHTRPAHVAMFSPNKTEIMSASDDKSVKQWDLGAGKLVSTFNEHEDYVRCGATGTDLWLTGSYDHQLKLWDTRTSRSVLTLDHGTQVEAVAMFSNGGVLVSAGSTQLKVWDLLSGGKLLHRASNHQKSIHSLCLHEGSSRLLSGGLDGHVKVYDTTDYSVTQNIKFPAPVLAAALSPNRRHIVVGMTTGLLAIRRREAKAEEDVEEASKKAAAAAWVPGRATLTASTGPRAGSKGYFMRGMDASAPVGAVTVTRSAKKPKLKEYDVFLRKFQYQNALDAALRTGRALTVVTVLEELSRRQSLHIALRGRTAASLEPLLRFLTKNVANPRYATLLSSISHVVLDLYTPVIGRNATIDALLVKMRDELTKELRFEESLMQLQGVMEMLMAAHVGAGQDSSMREELEDAQQA